MTQERNPQQLKDLKELLDRYDKLRSIANGGSYDRWAIPKLRLKKIWSVLHLQGFTAYTYDLPFAATPIRNEIRNTLARILNLYQINYLRTEKLDDESDKAVQMIRKYLESIPNRDSFIKKLRSNTFSLLGVIIGIPSAIQAFNINDLQVMFVIVSILSFTLSVSFLGVKIYEYFSQKSWHRRWMKKLDIDRIKKKIISELITLNDKTFDDLERKFQENNLKDK